VATQTVEFRAATGLTITAKLFSAGSDTEVASVTATEATNRKGTYSAAYTDVPAGEYQLIGLNSGTPVASWWTTLTLSTSTFSTYDKADTRDINTRALDIQSRIPATLDGGNMRSSVQSIGANTVSAASLASDAVAEIQSGLSTLDAAGVRASIGMASADMDTQLDAILAASGGGGDTVVVAPLVQTDSQRNTPAYIECNQYDVSTLGPFRVETATGGQFNFANQSDWIIVVWDKDDNELGVVAYGDIDFSSSTGNAVMDQYSFSPAAAQVGVAGRHTFSLRRPRGTTEQAPIVGVFNVIRCPRGPA
jgi:hypothetical protein